MEKNKKIGLLIISIITILGIPILLNWLLRISVTSVIGGINSDIVWLSFWANYGGAILGGLISLYILKTTIEYNKAENETDRIYNHNKFIYEQQKKDLDKEIERLSLYLQIYDFNRLKFIYNYRLKEKGIPNESMHMIGNAYSLAFERFNQFSVHYADEEFSSNSFLNQQGNNYLSLVKLLNDMQILIFVISYNWANKELLISNIQRIAEENNVKIHSLLKVIRKHSVDNHNILDALFEEYNEIRQEKVLTQIRDYIKQRKTEIEKSFIYIYEKP